MFKTPFSTSRNCITTFSHVQPIKWSTTQENLDELVTERAIAHSPPIFVVLI